jgi:Septum formation
MTAPAGLSGSVPEPRHPETTDPEPGAAEPAATEPVAAQPATAQPVTAQPVTAQPVTAQPVAEAAAVELTAVVPKAAEPPDAELPSAELPDTELPDTELPDTELPDTGSDAGRHGQVPGQSTAAVSPPDLGPEPDDTQPTGRTDKVRKVRRPLAVGATVVGIIALVGAAVAVLAVVTHGFRPKTVVTYRVPAVFSLRPGDCINSAPNGLSATVLSCATPHDAEVFAAFGLAGSSWPGNAVVQQEAGSGCVSRINGYLNPEFAEAGFAQEYIYPDQSAWQAGVRTVICEVRASSGQLTGSVRKGG